MYISPIPVRLIVHPVALINVTINMYELSMTMSPVIFPLPLISSTIWPNLHTEAISEASNPLACVSCTSLECIGRPLLSLGLWVVLMVLGDSFAGFVHGEILAVSALSLFDEVDQFAGGITTPEGLDFND
jgi:hypothetical protein